MDRNNSPISHDIIPHVALRKESVDRNREPAQVPWKEDLSLSARRAWIEIGNSLNMLYNAVVALRKESVDRN